MQVQVEIPNVPIERSDQTARIDQLAFANALDLMRQANPIVSASPDFEMVRDRTAMILCDAVQQHSVYKAAKGDHSWDSAEGAVRAYLEFYGLMDGMPNSFDGVGADTALASLWVLRTTWAALIDLESDPVRRRFMAVVQREIDDLASPGDEDGNED